MTDLQKEAQRYEDLCEEIKAELDCSITWATENFKDYCFICYVSGKHHGQSLNVIADKWVEEQASQRMEREKKETRE